MSTDRRRLKQSAYTIPSIGAAGAVLALAVVLPAGRAVAADSTSATLRYALIVSRHGVRSPTWGTAQLNEYSAQPWPDWGVGTG